MLHNIPRDMPADKGPDDPASGEPLARQQAVRQIERKRHFWASTISAAVVMIVLAVIWALSEYHHAGGWPVHGFSQSSGTHDVWNYWIIYPLGAWVLLTAVSAWFVYGRKPISEGEIKREIERQAGSR